MINPEYSDKIRELKESLKKFREEIFNYK